MRSALESRDLLRAAAGDGRLATLARVHHVEVAVLFGSALTCDEPGDGDLAVGFADPRDRRLLDVVNALIELAGDAIDVLDLDRAGPVARQRALTQGELLVELRPGAFATRQMAAMREFIETKPFRRMDLELMARCPRPLDLAVVGRRLRLMSTLLEQLDGLGTVDEARLLREPIVRLAVERVLSQLVDLAVDINSHLGSAVVGRAPERFRDSFDLAVEAGTLRPETSAALQGSTGLRNVLVHEYLDTDYALVADAVPQALEEFADYVRQVAQWAGERAGA